MNWFSMLKSSPCVREAKQNLYKVLEMEGANDELLSEVKNVPEDEIEDMLEEFQMEFSGQKREEIFEGILGQLHNCQKQLYVSQNSEGNVLDLARHNAPPEIKLASETIMKELKFHPIVDEVLQTISRQDPKTSREIFGMVADSRERMNAERQKRGKKVLSTRALPPIQSLTSYLRGHKNIARTPPRTLKAPATWYWRK